MDFTLSKKHEMARTLFKEFAENEVKPLAQETDENIYREDGDYFGQVLSCPDISNGKITFDENNKELIFYVGDKVFGIPVIQK